MAKLPDGSGDAYSNLVQGNGTASLTFVMPGTVPLAVGSVVATVDNGAGADTTATLVIRDSSGEVIATKRQGATIDAGASGTATWALRLDDEVTATPAPSGPRLLYDFTLTSKQRAIDTMLDGPDAGALSQDFACLDFVAILRSDNAGTGTGDNAELIINDDTTNGSYSYTNAEWAGATSSWASGSVAGNRFTFRIPGPVATAKFFGGIEGTAQGYSDVTTARFRQVQYQAGDISVAVAANGFIDLTYGVWASSAAIDRLAVREKSALDNLVAGSRLMVWGR